MIKPEEEEESDGWSGSGKSLSELTQSAPAAPFALHIDPSQLASVMPKIPGAQPPPLLSTTDTSSTTTTTTTTSKASSKKKHTDKHSWSPSDEMPHHQFLIHLGINELGERKFKCRVCAQPFKEQITALSPWVKHNKSKRHKDALDGGQVVDDEPEGSSSSSSTANPPSPTARVAGVRRGLSERTEQDVSEMQDDVRHVPKRARGPSQVGEVERALAKVEMGDISDLFTKLAAKSTTLTLDERFTAFGDLLLRRGGASQLKHFMDDLFFCLADKTDDERAVALSFISNSQSARWHTLGCTWALLAANNNAGAVRIDQLRKLELEFVYGVFETIFRTQNIDINKRLLGESGLRAERTTIATIKAALGRRADEFLRFLRVTMMLTLPLDMFNAIYRYRKNWYSETQFRRLRAACELGFTGNIELFLTVSEPKVEKVVVGPAAAIDTEPSPLQQIDERAVNGTHPKPQNDMMNKWFEVAMALLDQDDATALRKFMQPLFWMRCGQRETLCFVDMSHTPFNVQAYHQNNDEPFVRDHPSPNQ